MRPYCRAVADTGAPQRLSKGVIKVVGIIPSFALDIQPPQKRLDIASCYGSVLGRRRPRGFP